MHRSLTCRLKAQWQHLSFWRRLNCKHFIIFYLRNASNLLRSPSQSENNNLTAFLHRYLITTESCKRIEQLSVDPSQMLMPYCCCCDKRDRLSVFDCFITEISYIVWPSFDVSDILSFCCFIIFVQLGCLPIELFSPFQFTASLRFHVKHPKTFFGIIIFYYSRLVAATES